MKHTIQCIEVHKGVGYWIDYMKHTIQCIEGTQGMGYWLVGFMAFNATFNNTSMISGQSVLLVKETGVHGENHRPVECHLQTSSHTVVSSTPHLKEIRTHNVSGDRS